MCGICGIFNFHGEPVSDRSLKAMNNTLIHRGPDDEGYFISSAFGMAMRRLSIIDVTGGHQPLHNEDKTVWAVCNGELYNFRELKADLMAKGHQFYTQSDSEVVVHLYEEYGRETPDLLRGMFALAIWDGRQRRLLLARDHVGIKPLFYRLDNRSLVFGSEMKAIIAHSGSGDMDPAGLSHYLSFLCTAAPHTIHRDIKRLMPGQCLEAHADGRIDFSQYWQLRLRPDLSLTEEKILSTTDRLVSQSVDRHLISDVPVGSFLSGGLDSTLVTAYMSRLMKQPVQTFTIGFNESSFDERREARSIAAALGCSHREQVMAQGIGSNMIEIILDHFDEPFADYSAIPVYYVSQLASSEVTVVLTGDGGDELFGGYPTYLAPTVRDIYTKIPTTIRHKFIDRLVNLMPTSFDRITLDYMAKRFVSGADMDYADGHFHWKAVFNQAEKELLLTDRHTAEIDSADLFRELFDGFEGTDLKNRLMGLDLSVFLRDDILPKSDIMSMAHSLEIRVPLLDRDLIDFAATIPGDMKVRLGATKRLFRLLAKKMLPPQISKLRKKGFSPPMAQWLAGELSDFTRETLSPTNLRPIGLFNQTYVDRLVNEHLSRRVDHNRKLWTLIMFTVWWYRQHPL